MARAAAVLWVCPKCKRQFGRKGQGHDCAPAMTIDDYFSTGPKHERPIFDAVMARLAVVGSVHIEPVSVGIFLKRASQFAQLRPKDRWVDLSFAVGYRVDSPKIRRSLAVSRGRWWHTVRLTTPEDVDDEVGAWLVDAFGDSPAPV